MYISSKLDFRDKKEVTSSEPMDYMGIQGKGVVTSLDLRTKIPNRKQKEKFPLLTLTTLKKFKNSPYLDNKQKQVYNEPTEAYLFLIINIDKQIKSKMKIWLHIK